MGEFLQYQSDSDPSHVLSYTTNTMPSWKETANSGFQKLAYGALAMPATKINPWLIAGTAVLAGVAYMWGDDVRDLTDDVSITRPVVPPPPTMIELYRRVHADHPDYPNAMMGIATPWGGHSDPKKHNEGFNQSIFTSWTISKSVAQMWATSNGSGGIILSKKFNISELVPSPDIFREGEILVPGVVTGAEVNRLGKSK